jgi:signal transduction histidine kinase
MAVVALVLAAALVAAFSRGIARRTSALMNKAKALGERKPLGSPIGGQDEIAEVDRAFHETADQLEELHQAERVLRDDAERRATELARVNQDLKAKTLENETFVYSVSHDLRSPLVNLQGFSQELGEACEELRRISRRMIEAPAESRQRLLEVLDKEISESVKFIQTAVTRAGGIIDALLRLSRAGRIEYNWVVVPMRIIVHRIVAAMQSTIRQRGAVVIAAEDFPDAYGDATAIEQILGNLIGNAVNYVDPGRPGHVEIGFIPGEPQPSTERPDMHLRTYFVRDNGVGIPPAYLPKIFVAFQRLHGQLAPGEGIGLALVQRMVERHGGRVWAESEEGKGSTFFVSLPVPPKAAGPTVEAEQPKEAVTEATT